MKQRYPDELRRVPTLQFDTIAERWELHDHGCHIQIKYAWDGETWCEYRYFVMHDGHEMQAVTFEQYKARIQAIIDNEGEESATLWVEGQQQLVHVPDDHKVFGLRDHWEAMLRLGLFRPMVTHKEWEFSPLDDELLAKMNAARDRARAQEHAEGVMHEPPVGFAKIVGEAQSGERQDRAQE